MIGKAILPLALLGGFFYLLVEFQHVLLPFALAATFAYALNPLILFFEMRGVRRERAVMVIYTVLLFSVISAAYLGISAAIQSASTAAVEMPLYVARVRRFLEHAADYPWLQSTGVSEWIRDLIIQDGRLWVVKLFERIPNLVRVHLLPVLEMTFLVPFLTYFFMLDGSRFIERLVNLVPARHVEMCLNIVVEINHSFGNYLRGLMLQAIFMGGLAGIAYSVIGLHYAVYIALWVAATSMIPFLGPISAAAAGIVIALFQWGTLSGMLKVLGVYVVIRTLDDWILHPMIIRRAVHIHPALTLFSLMAGASVAGLWGLLFAVPIACMVKVLIEVFWQWYRIEYGLRPQSTPPEVLQIPIV